MENGETGVPMSSVSIRIVVANFKEKRKLREDLEIIGAWFVKR